MNRNDLHPRWRAISLSHMCQLRGLIREGRYAIDAKVRLKEAQRRAAKARQVWRAEA